MRHFARLLCALLLALLAPAAGATISCTSITSPGVSIYYATNSTAVVQSYFTATCTRTSTSDPTSITYDVLVDNGGNPSTSKVNRATLGTATLLYDLYADSACSQLWKNRIISDTITWASLSTGPQSKQTSYWACIVTRQTPTTSGTYTDSVGMTMQVGKTVLQTGSIAVSIYAPAVCTVVAPPADIVLAYTAFGPQVSGNTSIGVNCTSGMPYTIATDVGDGVLNGVRYILSLSATSATGSGVKQTHTVTATAPAGQAGTCTGATCSAVKAHTVTISY